MTEKSYVSMEQRVCDVCGALYDTGALLFDKRLRASMERNTVTGYGLCPEHEKLFNDGYVALVECDNTNHGDTLKREQANRTGRVAHLRKEVADKVFNTDLGVLPMVYVEAGRDGNKGVLDILMDRMEK